LEASKDGSLKKTWDKLSLLQPSKYLSEKWVEDYKLFKEICLDNSPVDTKCKP
jgi:hypothetical protein